MKLPKEVSLILRECPLPTSTSTSGKGRTVVTVGKQKVTVRPQACRTGRELLNVVSRLRRAIEEQHP